MPVLVHWLSVGLQLLELRADLVPTLPLLQRIERLEQLPRSGRAGFRPPHVRFHTGDVAHNLFRAEGWGGRRGGPDGLRRLSADDYRVQLASQLLMKPRQPDHLLLKRIALARRARPLFLVLGQHARWPRLLLNRKLRDIVFRFVDRQPGLAGALRDRLLRPHDQPPCVLHPFPLIRLVSDRFTFRSIAPQPEPARSVR